MIGHVATRWGLEHFLKRHAPLEALVDADFQWQEGWEYVLAVARAAVQTAPKRRSRFLVFGDRVEQVLAAEVGPQHVGEVAAPRRRAATSR